MPVKKAIKGIKKEVSGKKTEDQAVQSKKDAVKGEGVAPKQVSALPYEGMVFDDVLYAGIDFDGTPWNGRKGSDQDEDGFDEEVDSVESYDETSKKEPVKRMPIEVPYMTPNPLVSIIRAVGGALSGKNQMKVGSVVLTLDNRLRDKDVATAIALKHFFLVNGIPCTIHGDPEEISFRSKVPNVEEEITAELPERFTYFNVLVGVSKNEYLEDRALDQAITSLGFCGDTDATKSVAVTNYLDKTSCSTVSVIYPFIRDAVLHYDCKLTRGIVTEFYAAMQYSLTYARTIPGATLKVYSQLLADDADFVKVEEEFNSLPKRSLEFVKLLLAKLEIVNGIATADIKNEELESFSDMGERELHNIFDKSIKTFRYLEDVKAWCIFIEEKPKEYYVGLQTKNSLPYDMHNIAKRNNGIGVKNNSFCLIYDFDKKKLLQNLRDHIRDKDALAVSGTKEAGSEELSNLE